jgi:hypothetical protein
MNIIQVYIKDCLDICIYLCLGLGCLLLRIEPRGLYDWDIKVCTFSIDFMVLFVLGWGVSSFSTPGFIY